MFALTEQAREFVKSIGESETLKQKFENMCEESNEQAAMAAMLSLAEEAGYVLTAVDFKSENEFLDDSELEAVTGGYQNCICVLGGGGSKDEEGKTCGCVLFGSGSERGEEGRTRCTCVFGGQGNAPE